ncbi:hypothetical protein ABFA07_011379 [Porites harrisoni]
MAHAAVKSCGRVLLVILLVIQSGAFLYYHISGLFHSLRLWLNIARVTARLLSLLYSFIVPPFSAIFLLDATLNDRYILSRLFFGWRLYIGVVFVPSVIGLFGIAFYFDDDKLPSGMNGLTLTVCATPILLLLLLITADDSFSSKNHSDLVRNLSILMVSDLIDGIEMLDSTLKGNSYGIHKSFLILGAVMIIVLSCSKWLNTNSFEGSSWSNRSIQQPLPDTFL